MTDRLDFTLAVSHNKYLSIEDDEVHAILTVTANDLTGTPHGPAPEAAEVIAIDCSGSMGYPSTKISAARRATAAAIDALRDGVFFAVVAGTHQAVTVYPPARQLVTANTETRNAAKAAVKRLVASGETAMGTWLRLADQLLDAHPAAVRHLLLLTDGKNLSKHKKDLDEALLACEGRFVCDGRGIGDDYAPAELQRIVSTLHGSADAIVDHADLVGEFADLMRAAMSKVVPNVELRIQPKEFAQLRFVRQVYPTASDLTGFGTPIDEHTTRFSTGFWGAGEEREFHLCLGLNRAGLDPDEDLQAARVDLAIVHAGSTEAELCGRPRAVEVHWTTDVKISSVLDPKVAHYAGHTELSEAVKAGCDAHDAGDLDRATAQWGRAVALAAELGDERMLTRMRRLVDIAGDPANGDVRIKPDLPPSKMFSAWLGSDKFTRSPDSLVRREVPEPATGSDLVCPDCGYVSPPTAAYCARCSHSLGETA